MISHRYVKPQKLWLSSSPTFREKWVQDRIAEDPSLLGLGELILRDRERIQSHAGRLDLLLQDQELTNRYEVEIQLGSTNEAHIIRTIEYWDIERKRYPQYEHTAVIVAEDITSRFLNVISLFNGSIPLIALQMSALEFEDRISLVFTKVMDLVVLGEPDEEDEQAPTDRAYWETKASKNALAMVDQLLAAIKSIDSTLALKFNKYYIGLARDGQADNFVSFKPSRDTVTVHIKIPQTEDADHEIESAGIDSLGYNRRWGYYRIRMARQDIDTHGDFLKQFFQLAYGSSSVTRRSR